MPSHVTRYFRRCAQLAAEEHLRRERCHFARRFLQFYRSTGEKGCYVCDHPNEEERYWTLRRLCLSVAIGHERSGFEELGRRGLSREDREHLADALSGYDPEREGILVFIHGADALRRSMAAEVPHLAHVLLGECIPPVVAIRRFAFTPGEAGASELMDAREVKRARYRNLLELEDSS